MNISKFVQSLLPKIDKRDIRKNLENLREEFRDHTVPPYKNAAEILKNWDFKDKSLVTFNKMFLHGVNSRFKGNFVVVSKEIFNRALENITTLEKLADDHFSNDVVRSAMTYSRTQLLQYIEAVSFAGIYGRKVLMRVLAAETNLYRQNNMVGKELTPAELKWLVDNQTAYIQVMRALDSSSHDLEQAIKNIPNIEVDPENVDTVASSVGMKNIDPMGLAAVGLILNPIYHFRIAIAEWEVARYDAAKEERQMLEYQLLDLQNAMQGKNDPKLERAMEYTQDRIKRLNYKISKMEE